MSSSLTLLNVHCAPFESLLPLYSWVCLNVSNLYIRKLLYIVRRAGSDQLVFCFKDVLNYVVSLPLRKRCVNIFTTMIMLRDPIAPVQWFLSSSLSISIAMWSPQWATVRLGSLHDLSFLSEHSFSRFPIDTATHALISPTSLRHEAENICRQVDGFLSPCSSSAIFRGQSSHPHCFHFTDGNPRCQGHKDTLFLDSMSCSSYFFILHTSSNPWPVSERLLSAQTVKVISMIQNEPPCWPLSGQGVYTPGNR